uniref:Secreted peptide n=1 Tax=Cacopsylla melanoneura TaxID=428564 RepID=A0A8D8LLT1_9HEMI
MIELLLLSQIGLMVLLLLLLLLLLESSDGGKVGNEAGWQRLNRGHSIQRQRVLDDVQVCAGLLVNVVIMVKGRFLLFFVDGVVVIIVVVSRHLMYRCHVRHVVHSAVLRS